MNYMFNFQLPTKVIFGNNTVERAGAEAASFGKKALIVTGRGSTKKSGLLDRLQNILADAKVKSVVFNEIDANPDVASITKGAALLKKFGADCVVAVGGGSPLDAAKAIAVLAQNGGRIHDYFGVERVPKRNMPLIAIPTTSGTGSEVTRYTVVSDRAEGTKNLISSFNVCPAVAIVDPQLTWDLPKDLTAITGIDTLTHAVESLVCTVAQPITDQLNIEAARLVAENLPAAVHRQKERAAREQMSLSSLYGGVAINNAGTGIAHGLSYALTATYGIPHGTATGLLMPFVMEFNMPAVYPKYAWLAAVLGENVDGLPVHEAAARSVCAMKRLLRDTGMPGSLSEFGIEDKKIVEFAKGMMKIRDKMANNPRMPELEDLILIYQRARDEGVD